MPGTAFRSTFVLLRVTASIIISLGGITLFVQGCEEQLPRYADPRDVFDGTVQASYTLSTAQNDVGVTVTIRNTFDEELEGPAVITGTIEIVSLRNATVRKTFQVSPAMLTYARSFSGGRLHMVPGDEIRIGTRWDLVDDTGMNLKSGFIEMLKDTTCNVRCLGAPEDFSLSARINIYERTNPVSIGPSPFRLCYVNAAVDSRVCPPLATLVPCDQRSLSWPRCPPPN